MSSETNTKIIIYTDGLCEPVNPGGVGTWGWSAQRPDGTEIASGYAAIGSGPGVSNNVAEYQGVLEALRYAKAQGWTGVAVRTDSNLVVQQVNRAWGCKAIHLIPLRDEAIKLLKELSGTISWVPREQNVRADELTRIAYSEVAVEERRPRAYKMKGVEYQFAPPNTADEIRRLTWLAEQGSFKPEWQAEAKRLLAEHGQAKATN